MITISHLPGSGVKDEGVPSTNGLQRLPVLSNKVYYLIARTQEGCRTVACLGFSAISLPTFGFSAVASREKDMEATARHFLILPGHACCGA